MTMNKLTAKQKQFCKEYLIDLNATQAAIRAGYSEKTARTIAAQNLAKLNITEYIKELMAKRSEKVEIDAEWVLEQAVDMFKTSKTAGDLKAAKGFLELAGKHCNVGAFKERIEIDANVVVTEITRKII